MKKKLVSFISLLALGLTTSCESPGFEASQTTANSLQISSAIDRTNAYLNRGDCAGALQIIQPLYSSLNTNNAIRLVTASTYGCFADLKVFTVALGLSSFSGNLGGAGFWEFLVQEFPSTSSPDDRKPVAAENGIDAVISAVNPGVVAAASDFINSTSYNPGALVVADRVNDANTYLTFLSMALMGSLLSRYGNPDSSNHRTSALPWRTAPTTPGDGCALASATLHFYDGVTFLSSIAPSNMAAVYSSMSTMLAAGLDGACSLGCTLICAGASTCTTCPLSLRDRTSCTGLTSDVNSCAAAGINTFINASWTGTP